MQREIADLAIITLLVLALVIPDILSVATLEEIKAICAIIHAKHIGVRRFPLAHGRLHLAREDLLDFLVVFLELDDGKQVVVEPFEIGCAPIFPVGVVVLYQSPLSKIAPSSLMTAEFPLGN